MSDTIICRYGELALKGKNRTYFEKRLINNIMDFLKKNKINYSKIERLRGRILIKTNNKCTKLKNIFGLVSISPAFETKLDIKEIKKQALKLTKKGAFRISTQRLDKTINLTSQQINEQVGGYIVKNKKLKVSLNKYHQEIGIEIVNKKAYLFNTKIECIRGLPVGTAGKVAVILQNRESLKAAYLMLKRGCIVHFVKEKNIDFKPIKKYIYGYELKISKQTPKNIQALVTSEKINQIIRNKVSGIPKSQKGIFRIKKEKKSFILRPLLNYKPKIKL
jgi:thiamine biosynthesis protein ThiI